MDDAVLDALRQDPSSQFADRLRGRLDRQGAGRAASHGRLRTWGLSAAAAVTMAVVLSVPAVRASAASFLARFRVSNFVAVEVDPSRLDALKAKGLDIRTLLGDQQVVQEPGPPLPVLSLEQASAAAGYDLKVPGWLPPDARIIEITVTGEGVVRATPDAARLQQLLAALAITDVQVPEGLDGTMVIIRIPRGVMVRYEHGPRHTRFFQALAPEVTMPAGVDLAALGEIGLRILGVSPSEAGEFARVIDWSSTAIIPLPAGVRSMKRIEVSGSPGIAVEYFDPARTNMVIWSGGGRVFGIVSLQEMTQVIEMANSVR